MTPEKNVFQHRIFYGIFPKVSLSRKEVEGASERRVTVVSSERVALPNRHLESRGNALCETRTGDSTREHLGSRHVFSLPTGKLNVVRSMTHNEFFGGTDDYQSTRKDENERTTDG